MSGESRVEVHAAPVPPEAPTNVAAPSAPVTPPTKPRKPRPFIEWLWRGQALRNAHQEFDEERKRRGVFVERARLSADYARRALEPSEARAAGVADGVGAELSQQAAYWALVALAQSDTPSSGNRLPFDLKAAMGAVPRELLLQTAGGPLGLEQVEIAASLGDYTELPRTEQARVALISAELRREPVARAGPRRGALLADSDAAADAHQRALGVVGEHRWRAVFYGRLARAKERFGA
ncbi:MAG: hypothetical protein QM756_25115 [Polyangiaceae bacterium]